jgi:hypothetical protein
MQQLGGPLHNVGYGIPLLELDAAFLWLPTCKQQNWNMFIPTYTNHHHISQQTASKRIQWLVNEKFSTVMVDTAVLFNEAKLVY